MLERISASIKEFLGNHAEHAWLEHLLLYLFITGVVAYIILSIYTYMKINKDIKELNKDKRKRDKQLLKFLGKKNKTK
jgi:hypothetical protein